MKKHIIIFTIIIATLFMLALNYKRISKPFITPIPSAIEYFNRIRNEKKVNMVMTQSLAVIYIVGIGVIILKHKMR